MSGWFTNLSRAVGRRLGGLAGEEEIGAALGTAVAGASNDLFRPGHDRARPAPEAPAVEPPPPPGNDNFALALALALGGLGAALLMR